MSSLNNPFFVIVSILSLLVFSCNAQLSPTFYARTCPNLQPIVRSAMSQAIAREARLGASILRLFFHDCFVNVNTPLCTFNLTTLFVEPNLPFYLLHVQSFCCIEK